MGFSLLPKMEIKFLKSRGGAMEMSVGTMVTIVLLMIVLVLGIFFIQNIFKAAKGALDLTEKQLYNELNKLYSTNQDQKIIVYPQTASLEIKKGKSDGFGLLINNRLDNEETFSYEIKIADKGSCNMQDTQILELINLGRTRSGISLGSGDILSTPLRINFAIPESATLCQVLYRLEVRKSDGGIYDGVDLQLTIK